jgi:tetratricopeptide (TPR) repeat protein
MFEPCRLRVEIVGGSGDKQRSLFSGIWDIPGPVSKGDALVLKCELDENHVLTLELRLVDSESAEPFTLAIENPLTHVSNPQRERLRIDEREEALRNREVPSERVPDTLVELADGYRELRHREKALEYLRRALRVKGSPDADILNRMGIICGELGDAPRQEKFYREAADVSNWVGPLFNLALAQFRREEYKAAHDTIEQVLKRSRGAAYLVLAGQIAAAEGRLGDRDSLFKEARATFAPPAAMDDFNLNWAAALGQMMPDQEFFDACDGERRRRKAGLGPTAGSTDGLLPDVRGSLVRASS